MYSGVLALLNRSLRFDVRSRAVHLIRFGLMLAIYLAIIQAQLIGGWTGAPGLTFFKSILSMDLMFLTLIGISAYSSPITEEKEEDSLGLILMAGVNPLGLLLGKSGGRLMQSLALLLVQIPFALLAITLGGIGMGQIMAAYVAFSAYLALLAGVGMLMSTICSNSRRSSQMMVVFLILYYFVPSYCQSLRINQNLKWSNLWLMLLESVSEMSVFSQMDEIVSSDYKSLVWSIQFISNIAGGLLAFVLAWLLFDLCTRSPQAEANPRGLISSKASRLSLFRPGRVRFHPLVWKEFHFVVRGIGGILLRVGCYSAILLMLIYSETATSMKEISQVFLGSLVFFLPIDASLLISRSMQDEVRGQTISALVMLPRSLPEILYPKIAGALIGLAPGLFFGICALIMSDLFVELERAVSWQGLGILLFLIIYMMLVPHLTAVLAMIVRWGATPLAIAAAYALMMAESVFMMPLIVLQVLNPEFYMWIIAIVNIVLCVACHFEVRRRFRLLAEK